MSENDIYKPMTGFEMKKYNPASKVLAYPDLYRYTNIDDLFGPYNKIILLYPMTKLNQGHWVCLFRYNNTINFFDSYGIRLDNERKFVKSKYIKEESGQEYPYLTWLLHNSKYRIIENKYKLQRIPYSQTCGKFCSLRLLNYKLTNEQFINKYFNNGILPDYTVTKLIK